MLFRFHQVNNSNLLGFTDEKRGMSGPRTPRTHATSRRPTAPHPRASARIPRALAIRRASARIPQAHAAHSAPASRSLAPARARPRYPHRAAPRKLVQSAPHPAAPRELVRPTPQAIAIPAPSDLATSEIPQALAALGLLRPLANASCRNSASRIPVFSRKVFADTASARVDRDRALSTWDFTTP